MLLCLLQLSECSKNAQQASTNFAALCSAAVADMLEGPCSTHVLLTKSYICLHATTKTTYVRNNLFSKFCAKRYALLCIPKVKSVSGNACPTNASLCMQVAERSLFLWNNEYIVTLVAQHRQVILPVVFNALESNARSHWNPAVHGLTSNVKKVFQDMDMNLWRECEAHYQQEEVSLTARS